MAYVCSKYGLVVPACAGVILVVQTESWLKWRGSRMCGGDPIVQAILVAGAEWFPHVRG